MSPASATAVPRPQLSSGVAIATDVVRQWIAQSWREAIPFVALSFGALALRVIDLGARALHHDESIHSWFAWRLLTGHGYHYDPVYHGPVQFYLIALADLIAGVGDTTARLPAATVGALLVFIPFALRRHLGRAGALTASAALALSPSYLYYSRFAREDIYAACVTAGLIVVIVRFLEHPRRWQPVAFLGLLAVSFATKETTYITLFTVGLFFSGLALAQSVQARRGGRRARDSGVLGAAVSLGRDTWIWAGSTFLVVYTLLFSTFLTNPSGLEEGLVGGLRYWLSQQPVGRGGNPWFFYLVLIAAYEWPVILLGIIGIVLTCRHPTTTRLFLVWMFVATLVVYSWASERMPWLVLHPLLPLILLAGIGGDALWRHRRRTAAAAGLGFTAILAGASIYFAVEAAYVRAADPRELLVQVQTSNDVPAIRDKILRLESAAARRHRPLTIAIDSSMGAAWPWSWYLRDLPVSYPDLSRRAAMPPEQVIIVTAADRASTATRLRGYVYRRFRLRVWWVPQWSRASWDDLLGWVLHRRVWNAPGSLDEWLYLRPPPST